MRSRSTWAARSSRATRARRPRPAGLTATGGIGQASLSWTAAADDVGVAKYNVHRSATSGFTPSTANRVGQPTGTSYVDTGLAPGTWFYKVTAQDAAGNVGPASAQASATATADTTRPDRVAHRSGGRRDRRRHRAPDGERRRQRRGGERPVQGRRRTTSAPRTRARPYDVTWDTLTGHQHAPTRSPPSRATGRQPDHVREPHGHRQQPAGRHHRPRRRLRLRGGHRRGRRRRLDRRTTTASITGASWTPPASSAARSSFDGVDDRINVADTNTLDLSDGMTLEAWVHPEPARRLAQRDHEGGGLGDLAYSLYSSAWSDRPERPHQHRAASATRAGRPRCPSATWSHLAVTYDGTTLRLYVNGTQVSSTAIAGSDHRLHRRAADRRQRDLGRELQGPDRRGARLPPRADRRREIQPTATRRSSRRRAARRRARGDGPVRRARSTGRSCRSTSRRSATARSPSGTASTPRSTPSASGIRRPASSTRSRAGATCSAPRTSRCPTGACSSPAATSRPTSASRTRTSTTRPARTWFRGTDMARGRWYPTATTLPDGRILVVSGRQHHAQRARASRRRSRTPPRRCRRSTTSTRTRGRRCRPASAGCRCTRSCSCCRTAASSTPGRTCRRAR